MRVLVADDDPTSVLTLEVFLTDLGYEVLTATNGKEAFDRIQEDDIRLVISDWEMPEMNGLELCSLVRQRQLGSYVYFILLTGRRSKQDLVAGLNAGADDFLSKPFNPEELRVRMHTAERVTSLESRDLFIFSLAKLAESRDNETGTHLERMREYSRILAEQLATQPKFQGIVDGDYVRTIYATSPLHDIGKVGIPDSILRKPGRLTKDEFDVMKTHTVIGAKTLDAAVQNNPAASFYRVAHKIALSHHEKYNGTGYPNGLAGEDIPLCGRIVAVADVYDALTTKRVYKPAFTHAHAKQIIMDDRGSHFDPDIVDAFLAREQEFIEVRQRLDQKPSVTDGSVVAVRPPHSNANQELPLFFAPSGEIVGFQ